MTQCSSTVQKLRAQSLHCDSLVVVICSRCRLLTHTRGHDTVHFERWLRTVMQLYVLCPGAAGTLTRLRTKCISLQQSYIIENDLHTECTNNF